jgi:histone deacetylase 6
MTPEFEDRFSTQAMCRFDGRKSSRRTELTDARSSSDLFTNKTLVLFAHELYVILLSSNKHSRSLLLSGNLRLELESSALCDVHMEKSYLV